MKRSIIFLLLLLPLGMTASAQQMIDKTMTWGSTWDPDDPSCPCYKIQKQAEKEYMEMLRKDLKPGYVFWNEKSSLQIQKGYQKRGEDIKRKRKKYRGKVICPNL